ncbi:hypothetical protein EDD21DRAFT_408227 [Dissophora ornata]|nr:hypothetical protein BGZ58_000379 [Dissophora ornata]KAI8596618.1 hypothetical protein EDD21DRAFT_408227 [Dissophora ornata]
MKLLSSPRLPQSKPQHPEPVSQQQPSTPSALFIPEILEAIFSNLTQHTLHISTLLVCKQWYIVTHGLLSRQCIWSDQILGVNQDPGHFQQYKCLVLCIKYGSWGSQTRRQPPGQAKISPFVAGELQDEQVGLSLIREIIVRGSMDIDMSLHLPLIPVFRKIRVLRIEQDAMRPLDLGPIFRCCPSLQNFYLEPRENFYHRRTGCIPLLISENDVDLKIKKQSAITHISLEQQAVEQKRLALPVLKLRQFRVRYAVAPLSMLIEILDASPDLQVFSFRQPEQSQSYYVSDNHHFPPPSVPLLRTASPDVANRQLLYAHISRVCPKLLKFQYSQYKSIVPFGDFKSMVRNFPDMEEWAFEATELMLGNLEEDEEELQKAERTYCSRSGSGKAGTSDNSAEVKSATMPSEQNVEIPKRYNTIQKTPAMTRLRYLRHSVNRLTSLEIQAEVCQPTSLEFELSEALHYFLCDSSLLIHLKARNVIYLTKYLEFAQGHADYCKDNVSNWAWLKKSQMVRLSSSSSSSSRDDSKDRHNATQRIWACRGLQTLHLNLMSDESAVDNILNARVLFGYLSVVCPGLREIWLGHNRLALELKSGLCMLSRLELLESLSLESADQPAFLEDVTELNFWWMDFTAPGSKGTSRSKQWLLKRKLRYRMSQWKMTELATMLVAHQQQQQLRQKKQRQHGGANRSCQVRSIGMEDSAIIQELRRVTETSTLIAFIESLMCQRGLSESHRCIPQHDIWPKLESLTFKIHYRWNSYPNTEGHPVDYFIKAMSKMRPRLKLRMEQVRIW